MRARVGKVKGKKSNDFDFLHAWQNISEINAGNKSTNQILNKMTLASTAAAYLHRIEALSFSHPVQLDTWINSL
jgi:hypothetical protein